MTRTLKLVVCALILCVTASAQSLNGAGATFPNPIYQKWFTQYSTAHPGVQINYQSLGSGAGIRQVTAGTVDFGASDGPMTDEQLSQCPTKILHIPTVLGAVVPAYNIPGVKQELKFTPELLAGIFLGKINNWSDPAIAKVNPGVRFPNKDIVVVHRSDGSGTTYVFTDYLSKVSPEWNSTVGKGTSVKWPVGLGGKGNEGVAGTISQIEGSIGYIELIYAVQNNISYGVGSQQERQLREGIAGLDHGRRQRRCRQYAERLPRFDHQSGWQERLSDCELHLAADSAAVQGCEQREGSA